MKKYLAGTVIAGSALAAAVSLSSGIASAQYPVTTTTTAAPATTTSTVAPATTTSTSPTGNTLAPATTSTTVDRTAGEGANRPPSGGGATGGTPTGGATQGSTAGRLVRTGADADVPIKIGVSLIAAGGLAVLTVRRRRQDSTVAS